MKRTWTDSQLVDAVKESECITDVVRKLGLVVGGSFKNIKFHIERLNLDTSHFLSKSELMKRTRGAISLKSECDLFVSNGGRNDYKRVKEILIKKKLIPYRCSICGVDSWLCNPLTLQMDHINGDKCDNRLENLRLLCPNCHSQTDNFCGKNVSGANRKCAVKTKKDSKPISFCIDCGMEILRRSVRCKSCSNKAMKHKQVISWPELETLLKLVQQYGFSETGRRLGVSDNAVRKHIRVHSSMVE